MTTLAQISETQAQKATTANENFDALAYAGIFGRRAAGITGLTWAYFGGIYYVAGVATAIADGTVALTAATTNYVEATTAGVVSANAIGFTAGRIPLYTVVTGASTISSYSDKRAPNLVGDLSVNGNLLVTGTGPHSIGGAPHADVQFWLQGAMTGVANISGLVITSTLTAPANGAAYGFNVAPTLNKAGSGTHADFAALVITAPTIGAGAATLTNATTLKVVGAPSVGTNQRALWVTAGTSQFGGDIVLTNSGATGSILGSTTDGSDNGAIAINGGGAASGSRGASMLFAGNEHATLPGVARMSAGDVSGGVIELRTAGVTQVEISRIVSATRWITLAGSNGGNPTIDVSAGSLAITPNIVVAGTGPHAIGGATSANISLFVTGSSTPTASGGFSSGTIFGQALTATAGNDLYGQTFNSTSGGAGAVFNTASSGTHANIIGAVFLAPAITVNGTAVVTNANTVYIGAAPAAGTNRRALYVASGASQFDGGIFVGAISTNNEISSASAGAGSTTLYIGNASINVTSDERYKQNIKPFTNGLALVRRLEPIEYDQEECRPIGSIGHYVGFGAQRSQKVAPWAINDQGNQPGVPWQMRQEFLMAPVVSAVQELDRELYDLRAWRDKAQAAMAAHNITIY